MTAEPKTFELPEIMRTDDCSALDAFIRAAPENGIRLDGNAVQSFSGLAAQLIAGHQKIRADGPYKITIINPSEGLVRAVTLLGLAAVLGNQEVTL